MASKFSRVTMKVSAGTIDKAGAKYDRKVALARQQITTAEYALTQDWCIGSYRENWQRDLDKARRALAKLEAE